MIDAHCHLTHEFFDKDREAVISGARAAGIEAVFDCGANLDMNRKVLALAEKHKGFVFPVIGVSPHDVLTSNFAEEFKFIEKNAGKIAAIGEIGLEYHHFKDPEVREKQHVLLERQLLLSEKLDLPVVIHCRDAFDELFHILEDFGDARVMLHCFYAREHAETAVKRGYLLSIPTLRGKDIDRIIKFVPVTQLLCETDSPYLWGKERNEPRNVKSVYEKIAELKNLPFEKVVAQIDGNAKSFFRMK